MPVASDAYINKFVELIIIDINIVIDFIVDIDMMIIIWFFYYVLISIILPDKGGRL